MENISNFSRASMIQIALTIVSFLLVSLFSIDFDESGRELWLAILLIVIYVVCGFTLLDFQPKKLFRSLFPFFVLFMAISLLLSASMFILIWNPAGLVVVSYLLPLSINLPLVITNMIASIFPPLLLYIGLKLRRIFQMRRE